MCIDNLIVCNPCMLSWLYWHRSSKTSIFHFSIVISGTGVESELHLNPGSNLCQLCGPEHIPLDVADNNSIHLCVRVCVTCEALETAFDLQ